jgi:N-methylhydantoinase A
MADEGMANVEVTHLAELRYARQSYELEVRLPSGPVTAEVLAGAAAAYHAQHEQLYGFALPHRAVELVTVRAVHTARLPALASGGELFAGRPAEPVTGRKVYFEEAGAYEQTPIYQRAALVRDQELAGPAIVEQPDTTTVIYPGQQGRVDEAGNLIITIEDAQHG